MSRTRVVPAVAVGQRLPVEGRAAEFAGVVEGQRIEARHGQLRAHCRPEFDYLDAPIVRLGGVESPIPYNPVLEKAAVPQTPGIVTAVRNLVTGRI